MDIYKPRVIQMALVKFFRTQYKSKIVRMLNIFDKEGNLSGAREK